MAPNSKPSQAPEKKLSASEAADRLMKEAKNRQESPQLRETMTGIQQEAAEVMAGVEKPREKISERQGETGEKGDLRAQGGSQAGGAAPTAFDLSLSSLPTEEVMIKKIRQAIEHDIKMELKKAMQLRKSIATGGASEYNSAIAKVRGLKEKLAGLFTATVEFIKTIYLSYFTPDGKRR